MKNFIDNIFLRTFEEISRMGTDAETLARRIVDLMMQHDQLSQWLGIEIMEVVPGGCTLRMLVRPEMCNGFHVTHGGITYSLSDSALAFAANGRGIRSMSIETSINHLHPVHAGDVLTAVATEEHCSNKIGMYRVLVQNQEGKQVAIFKGIVYRSGKPWFDV